MKTNNLILVPTDFTDVGDNAVNHGAEIASALNYQLLLLHVIDKKTLSELKEDNLDISAVDEQLRHVAEIYQKQYDIEINYLSREGNVFDIIPQVAEEMGANLLIHGTHGKVGMQYLVGSNALRIVTTSPCPVIVVQKRQFDHGYKEVIFPVDDDTDARQKVNWAAYIAKTFHSTIHIFVMNKTDIEFIQRMKIITSQIIEVFDKYNVNYEIVHAEPEESFEKQTLSFAAVKRADLIMLMTKPRFRKFFLEPWDEQFIYNQAQIPVMCINPVELNTIIPKL